MDRAKLHTRLNALIEVLAEIEHNRWAHWQSYMHSKGDRLPDGALVLPPELVARWEAQIATPYSDLTEAEKDSDREQVRRYLPVLLDALSRETD